MIIKLLNKVLGKWDYSIRKKDLDMPADIYSDQQFISLYNQCKDYTMTSVERM